MKRVFAHLGFSAAVMLLILNFFSVTFAYIALGVVLAALCLVLSVPRLRQGVSVWLCLVGAVVACVTFIVGVHATYLPQQKLIGQTAQVQFYVTDVRRGAEKNDYTVKTTAIDLPGVPQNIRSTFSAHADLGDVPDGIYTGKVTFASTGENGYAAWGKFSDGEFLSGKASRVRKTNQSAPGSAVALIQMRHAISSRFAAVLPGDRGALATALITGSKTNLSVGAVSHFRTCGATHLMAVSGLHLSVIVGSLYWLLRKLRLPTWLTTVLTGAVLLVYDGVAGFSAFRGACFFDDGCFAGGTAVWPQGGRTEFTGFGGIHAVYRSLCGNGCELAAVGDFRSVAADFIPGAEQEPCSAAYSQIFAPKL